MAEKNTQLGMEDYLKVKQKLIKEKLKLTYPMALRIFILLPLVFFLFLFIFYLAYVRVIPPR